MGIDGMGRIARQQFGGRRIEFGVEAGCRHHKARDRIVARNRIDGERSAARNAATADQHHVEQELYAVLGQQLARQIPGQRRLAVLDQATRRFFGVAEIDLRAGRAGRAERQPAELQLSRSLVCALLDQLEREGLGLLILVLLHNLDAVDDRTNRADQVMAHARTHQRRKVESADRERTGNGRGRVGRRCGGRGRRGGRRRGRHGRGGHRQTPLSDA